MINIDNEIIVKLITAFGAITVVALTYWFTKQREREAEWRKEKFEHYKKFIFSLASSVGPNSDPELKKSYAVAFNTFGLFASQNVIECLHTTYIYRK